MKSERLLLIFLLLLTAAAILLVTRRSYPFAGLLPIHVNPQLVLAEQSRASKGGPVASAGHVRRGSATYSAEVIERVKALAARKAPARDPDVIHLVRDVFDAPANSGPVKIPHRHQQTAQSKEVDSLLKNKVRCVYVHQSND